MKKWTKVFALLLVLSLSLSLAACGSQTGEPAQEAETAAVSATGEQSLAGTYHFEYLDKYAETTKFSVKLRTDGTFTVMTSMGPLGDNLCNGTEWTDNGDGTFTTGATDTVLALNFVGEDGSIIWQLQGENGDVVPVGYNEPTEFLEKPSEDEPPRSGVYTLNENNGFMDIVWELLLRADGTYALTEVGRDTYEGESYTIDGSTVTCGPLINTPLMFTWADPAGFTVTTGESTFAPNDGEHELEEEPMQAVPEGYALASGVYTLNENNGFMDIAWELLLRADGTYTLTEVGRDTYEGESYTIDGSTVTCGPLINTPLMFTWADPAGFTVTTGESTFVPNDGEHELEEEPAEAIPQGTVYQLPMLYTFNENNGFMDIAWELLLRADGTYALTEVGRDTYEGESYTIDGNTVTCGPMINAPLMFTWANPEGFTVTIEGSEFHSAD